MTPEDRLLAALAAALAPARAERLLAGVAGAQDGLTALAGRLAAAPRLVRLATLAAALPRPERTPGAASAAARHPLLERLRREGGAAAAPPPGRAADAPWTGTGRRSSERARHAP